MFGTFFTHEDDGHDGCRDDDHAGNDDPYDRTCGQAVSVIVGRVRRIGIHVTAARPFTLEYNGTRHACPAGETNLVPAEPATV